jgi:adenosylhomocysteine nucleosidase
VKMLVVIPTEPEFDSFVETFRDRGLAGEHSKVGKLPVVRFATLRVTVSLGGLGKVRFAVQTQHLLDASQNLGVVICAGAAGSLADRVSIGDVVVATETVEHDIRNIGTPLIPRFVGAESALVTLKSIASSFTEFTVHFGVIASGDEDVMDAERRAFLRDSTNGLAVAWEGAGGARACEFSGVPFLEIRGIADHANVNAASESRAYVARAVANVATVVMAWAKQAVR